MRASAGPQADTAAPGARLRVAWEELRAPVAPVMMDFQDRRWLLRQSAAELDAAWPSPGLRPSPEALAELIVSRIKSRRTVKAHQAAMAGDGVTVSRTSLVQWVNWAGLRLKPIGEAIARQGHGAGLLSAANASFGPRHGHHQRLWVYLSRGGQGGEGGARDPALLWLKTTPDRTGDYAKRELGGFSGWLQASPHAGYDRVAEATGRRLIGCWAWVSQSADALKLAQSHPFLKRLGEAMFRLTAVEAGLTERPARARLAVRQRESSPVIADLERELVLAQSDMDALSPVGQLARDLWDNWPSLTAFLRDGRISLVNPAARQLDDLVAQDYCWIFGRSQTSRNSAATLIALVETCLLNQIEPRTYLARCLAAGDPPQTAEEAMMWLPWAIA